MVLRARRVDGTPMTRHWLPLAVYGIDRSAAAYLACASLLLSKEVTMATRRPGSWRRGQGDFVPRLEASMATTRLNITVAESATPCIRKKA